MYTLHVESTCTPAPWYRQNNFFIVASNGHDEDILESETSLHCLRETGVEHENYFHNELKNGIFSAIYSTSNNINIYIYKYMSTYDELISNLLFF